MSLRAHISMVKEQQSKVSVGESQDQHESETESEPISKRMRMHPYPFWRHRSTDILTRSDSHHQLDNREQPSSSKLTRHLKPPNSQSRTSRGVDKVKGKVNVHTETDTPTDSTIGYSPWAPKNYTQFIISDQISSHMDIPRDNDSNIMNVDVKDGISSNFHGHLYKEGSHDDDVDFITFLKAQFETEFTHTDMIMSSTTAEGTEQPTYEYKNFEFKKHRRGKKKGSVTPNEDAVELHKTNPVLPGCAPENYTQFIIGEQATQIIQPVDSDLTTFLQTQFENDFQSARFVELTKKSKLELVDLINELENRTSELQSHSQLRQLESCLS